MQVPRFFNCFNHSDIILTSDVPLNDGSHLRQFTFQYDKTTRTSDHDVRHSKGLIFKDDTPISQSFPYTPSTHCDTSPEQFISFVAVPDAENPIGLTTKFLPDLEFYVSYEGAIIRLVWCSVEGKWMICTQKNIFLNDRDYISNLFETSLIVHKCEKEFYQSLSKNHDYFFLMKPDETTRFVSNGSHMNSNLMFLGKYSFNENGLTRCPDIEGVLSPIPQNDKLPIITIGDFLETLNNQSYQTEQGIIIYDPNNQEFPYEKFLNKDYYHMERVRGTCQSLLERYVQIRGDVEMCEKLFELHPMSGMLFESVEEVLCKSVERLYGIYIKRYIHKNIIKTAKDDHILLTRCHSWHQSDRDANKVSKEKVYEVLTTMPHEFLFDYVRRRMV
jgi:hypothetical protein